MISRGVVALTLLAAACGTGVSTEPLETEALRIQATSAGLTTKLIPAEDPGPPLYLRASNILNELFRSGEWLVIPFYRDPSCVPDQFNVLQLFDAPSAAGPGAFGCALTVTGKLLIEPDAPLGTFPRHVVLQGNAVPFWFVSWAAFETAMQDGSVTFAELESMPRLSGVAQNFHETLMPRPDAHKIVVQARGKLEDGRVFSFALTHLGAQTHSIQLKF